MVREFRSMSAAGKSKKSVILPFLIYGGVGIVFGLVVARLRGSGSFMGPMTPYVYLAAIVVMFMILRFFRRENELLSAGAKPWHPVVSAALDKLSDDYLLLTGVKIAAKNKARWEIDYIIVGPNGVFLLEIRSETGRITVSPTDQEWTVTRKSKRGEVEKTIYNPLLTLAEKVEGVKGILTDRQLEAGVHPLVVFLQQGVSISDRSLPVVTLDKAVAYIKSIAPDPKLDIKTQKNIAGVF